MGPPQGVVSKIPSLDLGLVGIRAPPCGLISPRFGAVSNVALPLHQAKDDDKEEAPRPDVVRHAFNTPFWPMVLTTTSVGQEGLDFHPWCKTVAHWDPAPGPVELEQREGRVNRYAGLAIRRALSSKIDNDALGAAGGSPWVALAIQAEEQAALGDTSGGMVPWWCTPGASAMQLYLHCAGSRESAARVRLERRRADTGPCRIVGLGACVVATIDGVFLHSAGPDQDEAGSAGG